MTAKKSRVMNLVARARRPYASSFTSPKPGFRPAARPRDAAATILAAPAFAGTTKRHDCACDTALMRELIRRHKDTTT